MDKPRGNGLSWPATKATGSIVGQDTWVSELATVFDEVADRQARNIMLVDDGEELGKLRPRLVRRHLDKDGARELQFIHRSEEFLEASGCGKGLTAISIGARDINFVQWCATSFFKLAKAVAVVGNRLLGADLLGAVRLGYGYAERKVAPDPW